MEPSTRIQPPVGVPDSDEARRAAETFVVVYQVTLVQVEEYLEDIIEEAGPQYAQGYQTWLESIRELSRGAVLLSKKAPLKHKERFIDALRLFSFNSAAQFVGDICRTLELDKDRKWPQEFRQEIEKLAIAVKA